MKTKVGPDVALFYFYSCFFFLAYLMPVQNKNFQMWISCRSSFTFHKSPALHNRTTCVCVLRLFFFFLSLYRTVFIFSPLLWLLLILYFSQFLSFKFRSIFHPLPASTPHRPSLYSRNADTDTHS